MTDNKSISQLWKTLRNKHDVLRSDRPLAIGITEQIAAENDGLTTNQIQAVLRRHTRTTTYLRNVKFGSVRYHLDGVVSGDITDVQRELARLHLNERNQKRTMTMINMTNPAKTEKKRLAREAKHQGRLIKIQNKFKAVKNLLHTEHIICQAELDGVTKLAGI